jgi:hypothetical protein
MQRCPAFSRDTFPSEVRVTGGRRRASARMEMESLLSMPQEVPGKPPKSIPKHRMEKRQGTESLRDPRRGENATCPPGGGTAPQGRAPTVGT